MRPWMSAVFCAAACSFDAGGSASEDDSTGSSGSSGETTAGMSQGDPSSASEGSPTGSGTTEPTSGSGDEAPTTGGGVGPICGGRFWEATMDADPTTQDLDGDGTLDWQTVGRGFQGMQLEDGVWRLPPTEIYLETAPPDDFAGRVIVNVRLRATEVGNNALVFYVTLGQDDGVITRLWMVVERLDAERQTVSVGGYGADGLEGLVTVATSPDLGLDFIDAVLDADVVAGTVHITIAGTDFGTPPLPSYEGAAPPAAGVGTRGVPGEVDSISVERCP